MLSLQPQLLLVASVHFEQESDPFSNVIVPKPIRDIWWWVVVEPDVLPNGVVDIEIKQTVTFDG